MKKRQNKCLIRTLVKKNKNANTEAMKLVEDVKSGKITREQGQQQFLNIVNNILKG